MADFSWRDGGDQRRLTMHAIDLSSWKPNSSSLAMAAAAVQDATRDGRGHPSNKGVEAMAQSRQSSSRNIKVSKAGRRRGLQGALQLGPLGQGRPDRHAQPRHAGRRGRRGQAHQARQDLRARHPAGAERPAARPVRQALEPDPHHARHRHRCAGRPAAAARSTPTMPQHADPVGHALGFARPHLLPRQDVQRAPRLGRGLQRPLQARHRARQGQAGRPRRAARHRPLQGRRDARRTATASPTTSSTPAPRPRRSRSARATS